MISLNRNCQNCSLKLIDYLDYETQCWVCCINDEVISLYSDDSHLLFHSCLDHRFYDEKPFYHPILKVNILPPPSLPF